MTDAEPMSGSGLMAGSRAAAQIVESFLEAAMRPDPVRARAFMAEHVAITFTGGRAMSDPAECAAFNARRYAWVKKRFDRTDVTAGERPGEFIVYNLGTLYGAWPDGTAFEGNRYIDRYVVRDGLIVRMDVWNDSAEILLRRAGLHEDR